MRTEYPVQPEIFAAKLKKVWARLPATPKPKFKVSLIRQAALHRIYTGKPRTPLESATGFDKWLRTTIETQPYTAAAVALGIGWLLGRMHRPL